MPLDQGSGGLAPPPLAGRLASLKADRRSLTRALLPWVDEFVGECEEEQFDTDGRVAKLLYDLAEYNVRYKSGPPLSAVVLDNDYRILGVGLDLERLLGTSSADPCALAIWDAQLREDVHDLSLRRTDDGDLERRKDNRLILASFSEPPLKAWGTCYYSGLYKVGSCLRWKDVHAIAPSLCDPDTYDIRVSELKSEKHFGALGNPLEKRMTRLLSRWTKKQKSARYRRAIDPDSLLASFLALRNKRQGISSLVPWLNKRLESEMHKKFGGVQELMNYVIELSRENSVVHNTGEPFAAAIFWKPGGSPWTLAAVGVNMVRSLNCSGWHAESACIWDFEYRFGRRRLSSGDYLMVSNAQPCAQCTTRAEAAGISQILYAASSDDVNVLMGFKEGARAVRGITDGFKIAMVGQSRSAACSVLAEWQSALGSAVRYGVNVRENVSGSPS